MSNRYLNRRKGPKFKFFKSAEGRHTITIQPPHCFHGDFYPQLFPGYRVESKPYPNTLTGIKPCPICEALIKNNILRKEVTNERQM